MGQTVTTKTAQEAEQEIELICTIIRNEIGRAHV